MLVLSSYLSESIRVSSVLYGGTSVLSTCQWRSDSQSQRLRFNGHPIRRVGVEITVEHTQGVPVTLLLSSLLFMVNDDDGEERGSSHTETGRVGLNSVTDQSTRDFGSVPHVSISCPCPVRGTECGH